MSVMYTRLVCDKVISDIKSNVIKSYQETLDALISMKGQFRRMGLADMCWNQKKIDFDYSTIRMHVYKYDYRFSKYDDLWNNLKTEDKESLAVLMNIFESKTNILCGIEYDFCLGKELTQNDYNFISPSVFFLPAVNNGKVYLEMVNLVGEKVFFTLDKEVPTYSKSIKKWEFGGIYSLNKLMTAINDRRMIFTLDNEILLTSNYGDC